MVDDESGMVTIEGAYAISAVVIVVILAVGVITAVTTQIRCTDAAREVARLKSGAYTVERPLQLGAGWRRPVTITHVLPVSRSCRALRSPLRPGVTGSSSTFVGVRRWCRA